MDTTKKFDIVYNAIKKRFPSAAAMNTIHNVLWQVIVNENFKGRTVCFTCVVANSQNELAICEKNIPGYQPTGVAFKSKRYNSALEHAQELNALVFKISKVTANKIVLSTMRKPTKKQKIESLVEAEMAENEDYVLQKILND